VAIGAWARRLCYDAGMPAYLVHGVPDFPAVWEPLRGRLARRDVVTPTLPGFAGAPLPAGFGATCDEYAAWLIADIARLGTAVDLVGHDWGSILSLRIASLRPDLVRTLAVGSGPVDPEYQWHDTAVMWQTPEVGEQLMAMMEGQLAVDGLVGGGLPPAYAEEAVARFDAPMKDAILRLYRSAVDVHQRWSPDLDAIRCPTVVVWPVDDPFVDRRFGQRLAERIGAELLEVDGGHWWQFAHTADVAAALARLWTRPK
jgi:pimeloyl-ACP methyl ester carboxylesterase